MQDNFFHQEYFKAISQIDQGKQTFLKSSLHNLKQDGIQTMKKGCLNLLTYIRKETNSNLQSITIPILKNYIDELVDFKKQLGDISTNQIQDSIDVQPFQSTLKFEDQITQEIKSLNELYNGALKIEIDFSLEQTKIFCEEQTIQKLREATIIPAKFNDINLTLKNYSTLLYGPKGSGCSQIIRSMCNEMKSILITINSEIIIKTMNEFQLTQITHFLQRLVQYKPIIYFLKNIEEFVDRQQIQNFFEKIGLKQIINSNQISSTIIAQTQYPQKLDGSIRRCFQNRIFIDLPNSEIRLSFIQFRLNKIIHNIKENEQLEFSQITQGYSIQDLQNIFIKCEIQISENRQNISINNTKQETPSIINKNIVLEYDDLLNMLQMYKPSIQQEELLQLKDWNDKYNSQ